MRKTQHTIRAALRSFSGFLGIVFLAQVLLMAACAAMTPEQAQQTPQGQFIQGLGNKAISLMVDTSLTPAQLDAKYRELLNDSFDIETIGEFVIGRTWLRATPTQKQEYLKLFKELVLKTYRGRLHFYNGQVFRVIDVRPQSGEDSTVSTEIMHSNGEPPTEIDWVVRQEKDGKLAIIDVIVDGVSQSTTRRDEFASILAENSGNIDALLNVIRQNVQPSSADESAE